MADPHHPSQGRRHTKGSGPQECPLEEATGVQTEESGLLAAVHSLPEKYSAVLYLHYYEGYSIKEIAKLLGVPAPTVGTRLARGRERLRRLIKEEIS
ncbi:MAG: sigma-70 family RNA polymerase sigma factor [Oscillospiraceae bacterium]